MPQAPEDAPQRALKSLPASVYDPIAVQVTRRTGAYGWDGGFRVWPRDPTSPAPSVMVLGNSSGIWPAFDWAILAAQELEAEGRPIRVLNGAVRAHTSSQELLRVIRDVPAMRPALVLAMSGICDLGAIVSVRGHPFSHRYSQYVTDALVATGVATGVSLGPADPRGQARIWLDNHRFAALICHDLGIPFVACLQPVLGVGRYTPNSQEQEWLDTKGKVVLHGGGPYLEEVRTFYDEVRAELLQFPHRHAHVLDLTDCFENTPDAYLDHRHPNPAGNRALGAAMARAVRDRLPPAQDQSTSARNDP